MVKGKVIYRRGIQSSHYFGRGRANTRLDPLNADTLCHGCHVIWGSNDKEAYREFKIKQLGWIGYKNLHLRAMVFPQKPVDETMESYAWEYLLFQDFGITVSTLTREQVVSRMVELRIRVP